MCGALYADILRQYKIIKINQIKQTYICINSKVAIKVGKVKQQ